MRYFGVIGKLGQRQILFVAFLAALLAHLLVLAAKIPPHTIEVPQSKTLTLKLQTLDVPEEAQTQPKNLQQPSTTAEVPVSVEQAQTEQTTVSPPVPQPAPDQAPMLITREPDEQASTVIVPSTASDGFKAFIEQETRRAVSTLPDQLDEFSGSFSPLQQPVIRNLSRDTGPLGGGNYKTVKNGIECETYVQVPQSLDEIRGTVPLFSTIGNCRDLKKKIDLLDQQGRVRNSDSYEWN